MTEGVTGQGVVPTGRILVFKCSACRGKLGAREEAAGQTVNCPLCNRAITVPPPQLADPTRETRPINGTASSHGEPELNGDRSQRGKTTRYRGQIAGPAPAPSTQHDAPVLPGYEILGVLGRGGMGIVYRARQSALDRTVALKTVLVSQLSEEGAVSRFEEEALTIAKLRHPNIVLPYDFGRHDGRLYLVMELLEGETLEHRIAHQGTLPEAMAWGLARQAAAGLAHAAELGVMHRDIKPANLFLIDPPAGSHLPPGLPMVKITDFGLAVLADGAGTNGHTNGWSALGTPLYMAPEQFNHGVVDHRADVYALGATVYHMLSGQPPFPGDTIWEIMVGKSTGALPTVPDLTQKISEPSIQLVAAMLAKDAEKRISSYEELLARIDELPVMGGRGSAEIQAAAATVGASVQSGWPWRRPLFLCGTALVITALGVGLAAVWYGRRSPSPQPLTLVASHRGQALFDGLSLKGWLVNEGAWYPARDAEGGQVLSGKGMVTRRSLPEFANFRLTLGLDLHEAAAAEIHFGLCPGSQAGECRLVVRVSDDGVQLGQRVTDRGDLRQLAILRALPHRADAVRESPYREIRVERQANVWWAFFNGEPIGSAPAAAEERPEIRLVTDGGPALFDSLEIAELVRPTS
jgi:serine/threonine protein kinase